jgi:tripartite-type tricarboxylate transporter receptor subunit TctC
VPQRDRRVLRTDLNRSESGRETGYRIENDPRLRAAIRHRRVAKYPSRPVHIIVGFPAGGTTDIIGRLLAQWLSERLGQQFVVENRPGASTNIATEAVARAAPDGYTLLGAVNNINATLFDRLSFDFVRDIAPVASVIDTPLVVEVNPSVPARTVPEFIAYAKGNAGKLNMASPGIGTPPHVAGVLFKIMAGVDMVHVPYRGSAPELNELSGARSPLSSVRPGRAAPKPDRVVAFSTS